MGAHLIFFIIFTLFSCIILTNQSLPWYSLRSGFQCDTKMAAVFSCMRPLSRKPIGTVLGSSCLKAGTGKIGLVLILIILDQCTNTCLHYKSPYYALALHISHLLIFVRFPDFS